MGISVSHCVEEHICGNEINHNFIQRRKALSPPSYKTSKVSYEVKKEKEKSQEKLKVEKEQKNPYTNKYEESITSMNNKENIEEKTNNDNNNTSFLSTVLTEKCNLSNVEIQSESNKSPAELNLTRMEIELFSEDSSDHYPSISSNESVLTTISPTKDIPIRNFSLSR
jgi:hypothetical protein